MRKLALSSFIVAAVAIVGQSASSGSFTPTEGTYEAVRELVDPTDPPTNPNSPAVCKFGGAGVLPALRLDLGADQTYTLTRIITRRDGTTVELGSYACSYVSHHFSCTNAAQNIPFADWGLDATVIIGEQTQNGAWTSATQYLGVWAPSQLVTCEGADCDFLASLFGPDFSFPCGHVPGGAVFALR